MNNNDIDNSIVNHDSKRSVYTGIPECVLAEPKDNDQLIQAIQSGLVNNDSILITRIQEGQLPELQKLSTQQDIPLLFDKYHRTAIMGKYDNNSDLVTSCAIISAGTSDDYLVDEIGFCLNYFGVGYTKFQDIGVAGIHRHKSALLEIHKNPSIRCLLIVAGQDGALFPVIAAQTKLPVVAVPSAIGYGFGGQGLTALQTALQSCSPGVTVVNVDNGFGAATFVKKLVDLFE